MGYPPFCSETTQDTYQKIMEWHKHLIFPDDVHLSHEAEDLIRRYLFLPTIVCLSLTLFSLITSADKRLTVEQIKAHPFFYGVDWDIIRQIDAPFVPHLRSITDTSYFPTDEINQGPEDAPSNTSAASQDLAFLGFVIPLLFECGDLTAYHIDIRSRGFPYHHRCSGYRVSQHVF